MTTTEQQREYWRKWRKDNLKHVALCLNVNKPGDSAIYEHLQNMDNKQGYVKDLIRRDMEERN